MQSPCGRALPALAVTLALAACGAPAILPAPAVHGASPARAPLRLDRGLIVVDVALETGAGWRTTPLVLDLGAGIPLTATADVLSWAASRPPADGPSTRTVSTAHGDRLTLQRRVLAGVRLADRIWRAVDASEAGWSPQYAPPVQIGVLGWPLLLSTPLAIDLPGGFIEAAPPVEPADCIPFTLDERGVVVTLEIDGRAVPAILDTAATATLVTDPALAGLGAVHLAGRPVEVGERHPVDLPGLPAPMLVGVPFFAAYRVTLDGPRRCLRLDPPGSSRAASSEPDPLSGTRVGCHPTHRDTFGPTRFPGEGT